MTQNHLDKAPARKKTLALIALLLLAPVPTLGVLTAMLWEPGPLGQAVYGGGKLWLIAFPAVWWLKVDRGSLSWSPPRRGGLGVGLALGLVVGGSIFFADALLEGFFISEEDVEQFRVIADRSGIGTMSRYLAFCVYICAVNALIEEYVWRWFVFQKCERLMPIAAAVPVSALLFTVHHVFALGLQFSWMFTLAGSVGVFVGGSLWSWCYLKYRSVWPGYVSHVVVDVVVFAIGWRLLFGG